MTAADSFASAASIATDSEHSEPRIWWFWWLEVVVISRVHPSRIFLHQQTHGHSQWSLWVPLPQGKKSKKKKSTCCWGGHFRSVVETTRVSWPDLPFRWIWARKPRTAGQQKIWQTWDVACGNFNQFMRDLVGLVFKMLLNSSAHFGPLVWPMQILRRRAKLTIRSGGVVPEGTIGVFHPGDSTGDSAGDSTQFRERNISTPLLPKWTWIQALSWTWYRLIFKFWI